ncbi:hypothetical protein PSC71_09140 [Devosia sp. J2-20]|uniref:hypothetical protein n=1 Tax=Devosia sp. J2-20 TaxID=3026161 RepID=UPI00249CD2AE|nr:hypothetical protein [Devosia sp. J2-20]WDR00879.1 hypothetical protein PSC71_09140 [Devosia sp. J2-20]
MRDIFRAHVDTWKMEPVDHILELSKELGAARQVDAAIDAFIAGHYDVAITLAGAAEGMLEDTNGEALFNKLLEHPKAREQFSKKEWNSILNTERDWLKHLTPDLPETIEISLDEAAYMIARAASKIAVWSDQMAEFRLWYIERVNARTGSSA